jgi:Tfp pilus assembly protein PilE
MRRFLNRKLQRGFTLQELFVVIFFFIVLAIIGGTLWTAVHFIAKFW